MPEESERSKEEHGRCDGEHHVCRLLPVLLADGALRREVLHVLVDALGDIVEDGLYLIFR